jgi:hypothetical protein
LLECCPRGVEDFAHRIGGHALDIPQPLGNVEDEAFGRFLRQLEIARGLVALLVRLSLVLLRDGALLDRYSALPIGESGKAERQDEPGGEAAGKDLAAAGRRLPALPDDGLGLLGGGRRPFRPRGYPAFGFLQHRRPQQQPTRPLGHSPSPRLFTELGMLPDPTDIGVERFSELVRALLEPRRIIEEDEIRLRQCVRYRFGLHWAAHDWRKALVEGGCECDLSQRHIRCDGIGAEDEYDRIRTDQQPLDALPPLLEGIDISAVDQRLEAARRQRRIQSVGERHVTARIGDEDPCLWRPIHLLCRSVVGHCACPAAPAQAI